MTTSTTPSFCAPLLIPTTSLRSRTRHVSRRPRVYATTTVPTPPPAVPTPAPSVQSSFSLGVRFPRRLVGLYELKRLGVDPERLLAPNTGAQRGLGFAVGLGVVSTVIVPFISPWVQAEGPVAGVIALALALWAVDTLALNGALQRAASFQLQDGRRVVAHEAGHLLVAHLMGVRVEGYKLPNAGAVLSGKECGIVIADEDVRQADAYTLAALGMAGIAAECILFGNSQGGAEDLAEVGRVASTSGPFGKATQQDKKIIVRWGLMQAVTLLKAHENALEKLQNAMKDRLPLQQCINVIDEAVDKDALRVMKKSDS